MKSKGFTLIELIAVIVLLAVVAVIAGPKVYKIVSDSQIEQNIYLENKINKAVKIYIAKKGYKEYSTEYNFVTIKELKEEKIVDTNLKNSNTKVECADSGKIEFTIEENKIINKYIGLGCIDNN